jgi:riboflavin synthase
MFTGLVREMGRVVRLERSSGGAVLVVEAPLTAPGAALGDSIAVSGVCLTVTAREGSRLSFDASGETLSLTTLGGLKPGDPVNIEESLTPSARMGGHFVLGHVDGVGRVDSVRPAGASAIMAVRVPSGLERYLVPKGSVAVDGVSLTINTVRGTVFTVNLIPHTLARVTLGRRRKGDPVNIETDILVKSVEKLLPRAALSQGRGTTGD